MSFLLAFVFIWRTWGGVYGEIFPHDQRRSLHYRRWMPALQAKVARSGKPSEGSRKCRINSGRPSWLSLAGIMISWSLLRFLSLLQKPYSGFPINPLKQEIVAFAIIAFYSAINCARVTTRPTAGHTLVGQNPPYKLAPNVGRCWQETAPRKPRVERRTVIQLDLGKFFEKQEGQQPEG
jgi:hypothetical protein